MTNDFDPNASWFCDIKQQPPLEVYALSKMFNDDDCEYKVDLGLGSYRNEEARPWVLPVIRRAEQILANDMSLTKEYLPPLGYDTFCNAAVKILLGEDSPARIENRTFGIQTLSGTGALNIGAQFLSILLGTSVFYSSQPPFENHKLIFEKAGFKDYREYRYWNPRTFSLDVEGLLEDLRDAPERAVIILQVSGHNPTGCDPTPDDWNRIADVIEERRLFPFFDSAYQGFASGDLNQDAWPVRHFAQRGLEFFCAQSFGKIFSLYNERIGCLTVVLRDSQKINAIRSHFTILVRSLYSSPPSHGARLVCFVLGDQTLCEQWKGNLKTMVLRIRNMRMHLREELERQGAPVRWNHVTGQTGNFCYTGLNEAQVDRMIRQHHIYMLHSGRITISGLNPDNVEYVARAICETLTAIPPTMP